MKNYIIMLISLLVVSVSSVSMASDAPTEKATFEIVTPTTDVVIVTVSNRFESLFNQAETAFNVGFKSDIESFEIRGLIPILAFDLAVHEYKYPIDISMYKRIQDLNKRKYNTSLKASINSRSRISKKWVRLNSFSFLC